MAKKETITAVNGIDVKAVMDAVNLMKEKPDVAGFRFHINNKWINAGHNHTTISSFYGANQENNHIRPFELDADEPPMLAGQDKGANPVEHLLNALAACLTTTLVYHAAIRGIRIDELESELEGDIDLRGFLGISNEVRRGYREIRVNFKVKTEEQDIDKLKALSKLSPVFDVTTNGTQVKLSIERK